MPDREEIASDANALIRWSRSNHASSIVAGAALLIGVGLYYFGADMLVSSGAAAGVILVLVPIANSIN